MTNGKRSSQIAQTFRFVEIRKQNVKFCQQAFSKFQHCLVQSFSAGHRFDFLKLLLRVKQPPRDVWQCTKRQTLYTIAQFLDRVKKPFHRQCVLQVLPCRQLRKILHFVVIANYLQSVEQLEKTIKHRVRGAPPHFLIQFQTQRSRDSIVLLLSSDRLNPWTRGLDVHNHVADGLNRGLYVFQRVLYPKVQSMCKAMQTRSLAKNCL